MTLTWRNRDWRDDCGGDDRAMRRIESDAAYRVARCRGRLTERNIERKRGILGMRLLASIISIVVYLLPSTAVPTEMINVRTVEDLLKSCRAHKRFYIGNSDGSVQEAMSALNCRLFFQGFTEGHNMVLAWGQLSGIVSDAAINELTMFCPPPDATVDVGIEKFLEWAKAHPEEWTNLPGVGLGSALQDAWPCPKSF